MSASRSGAVRRLGGAADREHRRAGADRAAIGPRIDAPVPRRFCSAIGRAKSAARRGSQREAPHRRALVDLDAGGEQAPAQAQRQPRRLHRGRVRRGRRRERPARSSARRPRPAQHRHGRESAPRVSTPSIVPHPPAGPRRGRGRPQRPRPRRRRAPERSRPEVAAAAEPGVDALLAAELLDPGDRLADARATASAAASPHRVPHVRQREPHHVAEPPVPPTRPMPAHARPRAARPGTPAPAASAARPPTSPCSRRRARRHQHVRSPSSGRQRIDLPASSNQYPWRVCFTRQVCQRRASVCHGGGALEPEPASNLLDNARGTPLDGRPLREVRYEAIDPTPRPRKATPGRIHSGTMATFDPLADLPLEIEGYELQGLEYETPGFERLSTVDPPLGRRRGRARRGRHLRRARPHRPAGRRRAPST